MKLNFQKSNIPKNLTLSLFPSVSPLEPLIQNNLDANFLRRL